MQADLIGDMTIGLTSGIEPAFQPSSWQNVEVMSATIRPVFFSIKYPLGGSKTQINAISIIIYKQKPNESYEVFYPSDHEFIHAEILPSFYHNGPSDGYRVTQLMMSNNVLKMNTYDCDFCTSINDNGNLGINHSIMDHVVRSFLLSTLD